MTLPAVGRRARLMKPDLGTFRGSRAGRIRRYTACMTVEEARSLMHEWVASESLRAHMESVAACVAAYARRVAPAEVERWTVAGLLHDFDYERHPTPGEHPFVG